MFSYYEFFAGGGMARAGLGPDWTCRFANDFDPAKAAIYAANWGDDVLMTGDVAHVRPADLPGRADLVWASFPCQDLSLAGAGLGMTYGERSSAFWPFWELVRALRREDRAPRLVVLENVYGAITSHGGKDFASICWIMAQEGYRIAPLIIDAALFLPQSRPRLFILGVAQETPLPPALLASGPCSTWRHEAFANALAGLPEEVREAWFWLNLPTPPPRAVTLESLIEGHAPDAPWRPAAKTRALLRLMTPRHREKVRAAQAEGGRRIGGLYLRTRDGRQRAEVRFDGLLGCLRTPRGGSSRQTILEVEGERVRSRLLGGREAARLMGLPESYILPARYNEAYALAGDGVAVPAVRWLARHALEPVCLQAASCGSTTLARTSGTCATVPG